jgi:hypothetical protein
MATELTEPQKLWVAALRSGEYGWAKSTLQMEGDRYCCLGVACVVAEKHGVTVHRVSIDGADFLKGGALEDQPEVMDWLGLRDDNGAFTVPLTNPVADMGCVVGLDRSRVLLTYTNDQSPEVPFSKIADIIETRPEGLFVDPPVAGIQDEVMLVEDSTAPKSLEQAMTEQPEFLTLEDLIDAPPASLVRPTEDIE